MTISSELVGFFDERFDEVAAHLDFLAEIEQAARFGPPRIEGSTARVTAEQQKILYSGVYLQLYNLVEATVSRCIKAVTTAAAIEARWKPEDLNESLRGEWIRYTARTHVTLTAENRLQSAVAMCSHLIDQLPVDDFPVDIGGGGNWDDKGIESLSKRLGCVFKVSRKAKQAVKRPIRDELGALALVKNRRNLLAHGGISFVDCADGITVADLRRLVDSVELYLREAVGCFVTFIEGQSFLRPESIPADV